MSIFASNNNPFNNPYINRDINNISPYNWDYITKKAKEEIQDEKEEKQSTEKSKTIASFMMGTNLVIFVLCLVGYFYIRKKLFN